MYLRSEIKSKKMGEKTYFLWASSKSQERNRIRRHTVRPRKRDILLLGGGKGVGEEPNHRIIRSQESLVLYESFNIPWYMGKGSRPLRVKCTVSVTPYYYYYLLYRPVRRSEYFFLVLFIKRFTIIKYV
jgi:hypothetical protein